MEVKLTVPSSLNDITLGQYQKFKKTADKLEGSNDFLLQKMVECFCNVELIHVLLIKRKSILEVTSSINEMFTGEYDLIPTFTIQDIEFGFIPNLDNISQGEYIDLDTYITKREDMHKAMAVLFRPIKEKKGDKYTVHDYQGSDEFADLMQHMPLDVALGAYVFFYHLESELLNSTLQFLKAEAVELITHHKDSSGLSGDGIIQSINLLTERYGDLMKSRENPFINALRLSPINSTKKELSKTH